MSHAGSKSRFSPQRCSNKKEMAGSSGNLCGREITRVHATAKSFNDAKKYGRHADLFFLLKNMRREADPIEPGHASTERAIFSSPFTRLHSCWIDLLDVRPTVVNGTERCC